ncbi:helix-turn-helix domain-containing protein [Micromonosporaceae bacterium Da 78-11]
MRASDLVSIGEAAILLRSSRGHVVDLCSRGLLPYIRIDSRPRVRRADIEALLHPRLSRAELEQLWLHRAIAGRFVANPASVQAAAVINLRRLRRLHPEGPAWTWLDRWQVVLDDGPEAVLDVLTSSAAYAVDLRVNSPFAGALSEVERSAVLAAFADSRRDQARPMRLATLERVMRAV